MTIVDTLRTDYAEIKIGGEIINLLPVWNANDATLANCVYHGVKQRLGDAFNTFKGTRAEKLAQALKVRDNLAENVLRSIGEGDELSTTIRRLAVKAANKERGTMKVVDWAKSDQFKKLVDQYMQAPAIRAAAEQIVALSNIEITL